MTAAILTSYDMKFAGAMRALEIPRPSNHITRCVLGAESLKITCLIVMQSVHAVAFPQSLKLTSDVDSRPHFEASSTCGQMLPWALLTAVK